ncbi:P-loop containing nucleoside triphosphate hydrolase protein [Macrophomina phaseolina]|uniref:P-loop containing nucleoside triphosphate hydrolase protein n=1 Tax=Macrophomina phaseolina TaxID=35725 RepID=A0ABQ8FZD4_9PEZI|nr:P-loop containing nucleoside triphosphate hydrolase protein [Macrophomina phaseolina]
MTWDEFKAPPAPKRTSDTPGSKHKLRIDPRQGYVIEVLTQEPDSSIKPASRIPGSDEQQDGRPLPPGAESVSHQPAATRSTWSKAPPRVRIRSRLLLAHISEICNAELNMESGKMVFLRPYKLFCLYENEIRARYDKLQREFGAELKAAEDDDERSVGDAKKTSELAKASATDEKDSVEGLRHFRLLIELLDNYLQPLFEFRRSLMTGEAKKIAFDDLWHLFRLGQEVWVPNKQDDKAGIYRVLKYTGGRELLTQKYGGPSHPIVQDLGPGGWSGAFGVQCWNLAFDGDVYRPKLKTFGIRRYEGEKDITSLPIYPLDFDLAKDEIRQRFVVRGETFVKYTQSKNVHLQYLGQDCEENARGEEIDSEVIVDFKQAYIDRYLQPQPIDLDEDMITADWREHDEDTTGNPYCKEDGCCTSDLYHKDAKVDNDHWDKVFKGTYNSPLLEVRSEIDNEDDKILLPGQVYGYVLRNRQWATLSTSPDRLRDVNSLNIWNDLVIDQEDKDTIEALVCQHLQRTEAEKKSGLKTSFSRFITGKGRGLVFLLHGPPGVGKTSTAECIAAHTKKPLYSLTSGNLGIDPDDVEERLEKHFTLAAKWGCILLLDEADVFLQKRRQNQLKINAIVSVFLRQLEYYSGILFLTTNRVGDIDRAFMSRIHMSIEYKPFNKTTTMEVYRLRLKRLTEEFEAREIPLRVKQQDILDWAKAQFKEQSKKKLQWNGRQIFNAFQTAVAMAEWECRNEDGGKPKKVSLKKRHFEKVAEVSRGFEAYITGLLGEEWNEAYQGRVRRDYSPGIRSMGTRNAPGKRRTAIPSDDDEPSSDSEVQKGESTRGKFRRAERAEETGNTSDSD